MFAIEYFCGSGFQGWWRGFNRYHSEDRATREMGDRDRAFRRAHISPILMRVVPC